MFCLWSAQRISRSMWGGAPSVVSQSFPSDSSSSTHRREFLGFYLYGELSFLTLRCPGSANNKTQIFKELNSKWSINMIRHRSVWLLFTPKPERMFSAAASNNQLQVGSHYEALLLLTQIPHKPLFQMMREKYLVTVITKCRLFRFLFAKQSLSVYFKSALCHSLNETKHLWTVSCIWLQTHQRPLLSSHCSWIMSPHLMMMLSGPFWEQSAKARYLPGDWWT